MLKLRNENLYNVSQWSAVGVNLPAYDRFAVTQNTKDRPEWIHFGAGNIFRAFVATCHQELLNKGLCDTGIVAVETFDPEVIEKIFKPFDDLSMDVSIDGNGELDLTLVASITMSLIGDQSHPNDWQQLVSFFTKSSLKIISFTVTEKGYIVFKPDGNLIDEIQNDLENNLENPTHLISKLIVLLGYRFKTDKLPVALLSLDNCSQNGEKLQKAILAVANKARQLNLVEEDFVRYLSDEKSVSFPWSMIDKITPRPSLDIENMLTSRGIDEMRSMITSKNTYMAPYVNSEHTQYLFIENQFPNGCLPIDKARGVWITDRKTVNTVETMKVTTCLNPLHTALAIFGRLLGRDRVMDAIHDPDIRKLVERIGYQEGLPVVTDPGIINPKEFLDEVLNSRFPNPYIPDTTARIASDTSLKMAIRFGETIKAYSENPNLSVDQLVGISLVIAAWLRYLLGNDDNLEILELSPDPMLKTLQNKLHDANSGGEISNITSILEDSSIFGLDLCKIGMCSRIEKMFSSMNMGKGSVRKTLGEWLVN